MCPTGIWNEKDSEIDEEKKKKKAKGNLILKNIELSQRDPASYG